MELALRGISAGLIIAAPVGPVNVLCIQRTLERGWKSGLLSGVGAALADTLYGSIAGFGISLVIQFLIGEQFWFRLIGGLLLMGVGVWYYRKPPTPLQGSFVDPGGHSDLTSTFLLTAANPTTVLSFLAVLATLGLGERRDLWQTSLLVGGTSLLRDSVTDRAMGRMNRIAGIAIGAFGLVNVLLSRGVKH